MVSLLCVQRLRAVFAPNFEVARVVHAPPPPSFSGTALTKGLFGGYLSLVRSKGPDTDAGIGRTNFVWYLWWSGASTERLRGRDAVTIRILVTEDDKLVRQGLRMVLELDPDLE